MHLPKSFDAECIALMSRVCYDAWWELKTTRRPASVAADPMALNLLALRVMEAVGRGERDPRVLRDIALAARAGGADLDWKRKTHAGDEVRA